MNRVEIAYLLGWPKPPKDSDLLDRVESVVERAILAEREACAGICDRLERLYGDGPELEHWAQGFKISANAIRARGQE
jgi:hypothetical protein